MSVNGLRGFIADPVGTLETLGFEDADHDKAEALIYYAGRVSGIYASQSDSETSRTAVHDWAEISSLNLDSLRLLLVGKTHFDQPDVRGWTPLHLAARGLLRHFEYGPRSSDEDVQASLDAVKALLVAGADPTRITDDGFHFANALTTAIVRSDEVGSGLTQGMRELAEVLGLPASPAAGIP